MLVAAMASGGETIAPSATASGHPSGGMRTIATTATAAVVMITRPTARRLIGRMLRHSSRGELRYAAEKRIGGRKTSSTISSSSSMYSGEPGIAPRRSPAISSRIGYGTPMRRDTSVMAATTARSRKTISNGCMRCAG